MTAIERQIFQGAAVVFSVSLLLNGANLFYKGTILAPVEGGSYVEGLIGQPSAINPVLVGNNDVDRDLINLLFSNLLDLTKSYKISDDRKSWTIQLKEGARWNDGQPLTGDDVIFTLTAIQNPETNSPLAQTWEGVSAQKLNALEIRFNLKTPYAFFLDNLKNLSIIPQHIFKDIPDANLRFSDYNIEPVGSGPYQFSGYDKRKDGFIIEYRITANQNYRLDAPLIKDLKFKFFPNYAVAIAAFNKKEIDGLGGLPADQLDNLKISYQLQELDIPRYYALFFNTNTAAALKNKEVRTALNLATDRNAIIGQIFNGKAAPITGPIYPGTEGYDSVVADAAKFSTEEAIKLLDVNQWQIGAAGIREKKIGADTLKLEFEIVVPQIDFLSNAVKIIAADWQKIGVSLKPVILSPSEITNSIIKERKYQMLVFGNILKNSPDIFSFWHSSEKFYPGLNLALYDNKNADALLEAVRKEFDTASRQRDLKKIQALIGADQPVVFLFSPAYLYIRPKDLGGFTEKIIAAPADRFNDIAKWYLKTARIFK